MTSQSRPLVPRAGEAPHPRIDPNFAWAGATGFRDFIRPGQTVPDLLPVIVELKSAGTNGGMAALLEELGTNRRGFVGAVYRSKAAASKTQHLTACFSPSYCRQVLSGKLGRMIERFELQLPVIPQRARPLMSRVRVPAKGEPRAQATGKVMFGLIDSGCAFAHHQLRDRGGRGTRVLNIWDQDEQPAHTRGPFPGRRPADFGYGCEVSRQQLNGIMAAHMTASGVIDEAACYAAAGDLRLRRRFNHGMAVLGLMAGYVPAMRRKEAAASADIVFVQLPRDCVQDSSSASLSRFILDGLRYIVSCAGKDTEQIVVNLSDGSSRGTHDGNSIIEKAMLELIKQQNELTPPRTLSIAIAAGNSYDEERHAQFDTLEANQPRELTLRVPPGSETPFFVSLVLPVQGSKVEIRVTPPDQKPDPRGFVAAGTSTAWPDARRPICGVVNPHATGSNRTALVALAPTASFDAGVPIARAGDWLLEVRSTEKLNHAIHVYIPRTQQNPGALRRALQARFIDVGEIYDPQRHQRAWERDPEPPRSPLRRSGTLSSLATVPVGLGIHVIGSYLLSEGIPSLYSSEGPALPSGTGSAPRPGPDALAVTDVSRALRGIRAAGTLSGDVVRVTGTSFAAPQKAWALANGAAPAVKPKRAGAAALAPAPDDRCRARTALPVVRT